MSDVILKGLTTIQDAVDKMSPEEVHLRFELSQHKKENEQLKQQLEDYKQENQLLIETNCELLNGELVKRLQQQLEVENKNNYEMSAEMEHLRNQLKEAVEVIEKGLMCDTATYVTSTGVGVIHKDDCFKCAFLAKYRGSK